VTVDERSNVGPSVRCSICPFTPVPWRRLLPVSVPGHPSIPWCAQVGASAGSVRVAGVPGGL